MADHALPANLESCALFVFRAAANARENQVIGFSVTKPDVDFDVADGCGNVVDDAVEQGIQLKGRGDEIGGAL